MSDKIYDLILKTQDLSLLYVEDNGVTRESTLEVFKEFFGEITLANNGKEGFEQFQNHNFDLIITDIKMPIMDGLEMSGKIRGLNKEIPILVLSAHDEGELFYKSIHLQITGYIFKPLDINQFVNTLSSIVSNILLKKRLKKQEYLLKQYQAATDKIAIVSKTDPDGVITYVNKNFSKLSEYLPEELMGHRHNIIRDLNIGSDFYENLWKTIKDNKSVWSGTIRNRSKTGKKYYLKTSIVPIFDEQENIIEYIALQYDITNIIQQKTRLDDELNDIQEPLVVYMKIENYKTLQEMHRYEDIQNIVNKLATQISKYTEPIFNFRKLYKMEYGEFIIVADKNAIQYSIDDIIEKLKKIQKQVNPYIIISLAYEGDDLLDSARLGIRDNIKNNRDFVVANHFLEYKKQDAKQNIQKISIIKDAIDNYGIVSYFQPIINNNTKSIDKFESLVRLVDSDQNVISPADFLGVSKNSRYYYEISSTVIKNSFAVLEYTENVDISINLSALDIESSEIRELIYTSLDKYKNDAHRIIFELLEDEVFKDFDAINQFITNVKIYGVKIAIDDFGTGHSNYERVLEYQPDILKIDGKLIKNILTDNYSESIVKSIILFAETQHIKTVAEFVESKEIYEKLFELGIDYSQGYYFGKPKPMKEYLLENIVFAK